MFSLIEKLDTGGPISNCESNRSIPSTSATMKEVNSQVFLDIPIKALSPKDSYLYLYLDVTFIGGGRYTGRQEKPLKK